jgi:DNA-binding response OmpR family regulator
MGRNGALGIRIEQASSVYAFYDKDRILLVRDEIISFTPTEYPLVKLLLSSDGALITDQQLITLLLRSSQDGCQGGNALNEHCLPILWRHMSNVRKKLGTRFCLSRAIGLGYILVLAPAFSQLP